MTNDPITLQPIGYVRTDIAERRPGKNPRGGQQGHADETGLRVAGRWPSYRRNAEGRANTVVTKHAEYTALVGLLEG
jgi:hypothetical protein